MGFDRIPWAQFPARMQWAQGEHVTIIAPTGQGKTTLARAILPARSHVMVLATKKRDKTLDLFQRDGFRVTQRPQPYMGRVLVKPPFPKDASKLFAAHAATFRATLNQAYLQGYWCVYLDEIRYLTSKLGLQDICEILLLQGRSLGVSVVAATQRPRHIPLEFYDQPTHLFFFKDTDGGNVERIAEIGGLLNHKEIMARIPRLDEYHFLYVNTRTNDTLESKVDL